MISKNLAIECIKSQRRFVDDTTREAFNMAIKVLEEQERKTGKRMEQIELVIRIPEEEYAKVKDGWASVRMMRDAIRNGTPLPKGHGDLKDADKLAIEIAMMRDRGNYYGNEYEQALFQAYDISVDEIIDAPTIIEADKEGAEK